MFNKKHMAPIERPRYPYTDAEKQTLRELLEEILEEERDFGIAENAEISYGEGGSLPVLNRTTFCVSIERVKQVMPDRLVQMITEIK